MAQMDGMRYAGNPTGDQLLASGDETHMQYLTQTPMSMTPTLSTNYDHEEDHNNHHAKKSVLAKVKDKAKKWRNTLSKKKHDHDGGNFTPAWGVKLEDEEEDEEAPEYHGAPMYESELAPSGYSQTSTHQPSTTSPTSQNHALESSKVVSEADDPNGKNGNKTITETVTGMLAPAYTMVSDATNMITSKIQGGDEANCKNKWDKGVSVREYLKQKLEPGEDERALSQVISEAMSPRSGGDNGELGVVEKVKEAVSSLLGVEEPSSSIPVSSNAREEIIEETAGKRLQTN